MPESRPLGHLRVVELTDDLPGAYCAQQFAFWGAEVVTLEPQRGSPLRRRQPLVRDGRNAVRSLLWEYVSLDKRQERIDLDGPDLRRDVESFLEGADVLVCDLRRSRLDRAGLDHASLAQKFPRLVFVSTTPFGLQGPYAELPATEIILEAVTGFLTLNGLPGREPLKAPANVMPYACGVSAFVGALAALHERNRGGRGQLVDASNLEALASLVVYLRTEYTGEPARRQGGPVAGSWSMIRCQDGFIAYSPFTDRGWDALVTALGLGENDAPEGLRTADGRRDRSAVLAFVETKTASRPARELFLTLSGLGQVCGLARSAHQLLSCDHLAARGYFRSAEIAGLGAVTVPGPPGQVREGETTRLESDRGDMPRPEGRGVDGVTMLPPSGGDTLGPPLADVRILDLTAAWIGPYATLLLTHLGAQLIKIESPRRPDVWRGIEGRLEARGLANPDAHPWNTNANYNSVNMGKPSLALDLASDNGKELFRRLVTKADLVVENYTPRVMDNFGLGYEALRQLKPDLIMVSFSGFGATGPFRDFKTNGAATETNSGWDMLMGYPDGPPMMMGIMQADAITGLQMAAHALVALLHRERTGRGQRVDGSMYEAAAGYVGEEIMLASINGESARRRGNRDRDMAPHGLFPCAGEDRWVAVAVRDDADWAALLSLAGEAVPALRDSRLATAAGRLAAEGEAEALVADWTRKQTREAAATALQAMGVPAAAVQRTDEVLGDAHFAALDWFRTLTHADMGTHKHNGPNWRFSRSPLARMTASPRLGEHSADLLRRELGLDDTEIDALFTEGVTGYVFGRQPEEEAAG